MDTDTPGFSTPHDLNTQPQIPMQPQRPREKSKRPQLSCNPCRLRKVKCDRIQPCTACSLHQIAEHCEFDLSEAERHPILQAEALKEKDKTIAQLRNDLSVLRGKPIKAEPADDIVSFGQNGAKIKLPPRSSGKKSNAVARKRDHLAEMSDNIYFGSPGMTSVVEEFAHLAFDRKPASLTHAVPRGTDIFAFQLATSHPFPTLWSAKDDITSLIKILPPEEDLYFYLDSFQRRVQSCSFPHAPDECTKNEVRRFLENVEHNAALHLDMLALLFVTLAQGLQYGVYDKYGERWVPGAVEAESKKSDVYIAASMQCLRLGCFMNRPTLLVIETLVMMGPHLTNSGKFLDASALFGVTARLAQSIGLHRDPSLLNPPAPPKQVATRKNLWWWIMHMDMQYSMSLGRPLGVSSMGDCPAPDPISRDPINQSLSNYLNQFSILGRRILSAAYLSNEQIDDFTDQLLELHQTLPDMIRFDVTWLDKNRALPSWPLDAQAGVLHANLHNFLLLLNRQRIENGHRDSDDPQTDLTPTPPTSSNARGVPRGRERVLQSCRALLIAFEFFQTRVRAALICWTLGQMAFNASMILLLSMLETSDTQDLHAVERTYSTFLEMNKLGVHKLAGAAVERLGIILKEYRAGDPATETVMGQQGMMLLEDPGLQGSLPESFSPLNFQMAGGADTPGMQRSPTGFDAGHHTSSQIGKKKTGRRPGSARDDKTRPPKKHSHGSQRPLHDRRFSDGASPRPPHKKKRTNRATPNLSVFTNHPGQHSFSVTPHPTVKPETLYSSIEQHHFQGFNAINAPVSSSIDRINEYETTPRPQAFVQPHPSIQNFPHQHQQAASDPGDRSLDFSNSTTPGTGGSEFFDDSFQHSHEFNFDMHSANLTSYDHQPFSAPAYSMPGQSSSSSSHHHYGF